MLCSIQRTGKIPIKLITPLRFHHMPSSVFRLEMSYPYAKLFVLLQYRNKMVHRYIFHIRPNCTIHSSPPNRYLTLQLRKRLQTTTELRNKNILFYHSATQLLASVVTALLLLDFYFVTNSISLQSSHDLMTFFLICGLLNYAVSVSQVIVHTMIGYLVTNGLESTKK